MSRRTRSAVISIASLALAFGATACGSSSSGGDQSVKAGNGPSLCGGQTGSGKVVVGAAGFSENETLAAIYAAALKECGYDTSTKTFDSREVYYPALKKGTIGVVPEYAATLTDFINGQVNGANAPSKASGQIDQTMTALKGELPSSLAALDAADATDKNAFAIPTQLASDNNITTMSELATYTQGHPLTLAGPPECPTRPFCEPGLKKTYNMKIAGFKQTDAGGPLTIKALKQGTAQIGLVFTSDPTISAKGFTVLDDDKNLQASDNIVPIVSSSLANGAAASALNAISAKLDEQTLLDLNKAVIVDHGQPAEVAAQFLQQAGLTS
ncbi:MAG: ABC transporter substrate-binding protein [Frankiaceae bacterium]|nr:ABC transporter substrate-binding protein [Frankiaceae bacterium]MBV9870466.1 ABC transporter substrate-binding protein [Frankiaceae bacterium]